jgi:hypothetical protein
MGFHACWSIAAIACALFICTQTAAQETPVVKNTVKIHPHQAALSPEERERATQIELQSIKWAAKRYRNRQKGTDTKALEPDDIDQDPVTVPIAHYRGIGGVELPDKFKPVFSISRDQIKAAMVSSIAGQVSMMKKFSKPAEDLPNCKKSKIDRHTAPVYDPATKDRLWMDMLFVREELMPEDTRQVYGEKVIVRPFQTKRPSAEAWAVKDMGVVCVPYRIRIVGPTTYYMQGAMALRNFELEEAEQRQRKEANNLAKQARRQGDTQGKNQQQKNQYGTDKKVNLTGKAEKSLKDNNLSPGVGTK